MTPEREQFDREQIEQLIGRRLDGELTPAESLEFDKLLLRDPQARRDFESSARIDALAEDLFAEVCSIDHAATPAAARPRLRMPMRQMVGFAAAACLVMWGAWPTLFPKRGDVPVGFGSGTAQPLHRVASAPVFVDAPASGSHGPRVSPAIQPGGRTTLNYYGVLDERNASLYLLEVRQTQQYGDSWLLGLEPRSGQASAPLEGPSDLNWNIQAFPPYAVPVMAAPVEQRPRRSGGDL